jgi:hypothetical protein
MELQNELSMASAKGDGHTIEGMVLLMGTHY